MPPLQASQTGRRASDLRKRRAPSTSPQTKDAQDDNRPPKKQKLNHPAIPPPKFWDNLSEIPLTRRALQELDRRHSQSTCHLGKIRIGDRSTPQPQIHNNVQQCSSTFVKELQRCARQGGPCMLDLRGYRIPLQARDEMSASQSNSRRRKRGPQSQTKRDSGSPSKSSSTPAKTSTKSTSPYDRAFQQNLIDHDIFPIGYQYPDGRLPPKPENMGEIGRAMVQRRRSLSPSRFTDDEFDEFQITDFRASKEAQVTSTVIPVITGGPGDATCIAAEIPFTNLDPLTDGTLVAGSPDLYYGARPEQLDRIVRRELNNRIVPSSQHDLPILPNFFLEVKAREGSLAVASRQACYDGALGARAIHSLQSYGQTEPKFDSKAYAITSTYHGGTLTMYTTHPIPPPLPNKQPGFVMTPITSWALNSNPDNFRQGAAAYRNLQDWAKEQRDNAIRQANEIVSRDAGATPSENGEGLALSFTSEASAANTIVTSQTTFRPGSNAQTSFQSDSSDDPLSLGFQPPMGPPAKRAKS
ncbi:hypothetical protein CDD83_10052 [Cordyceps sp. RAO-2017]|nr:hypothetical protein CDD83_10052 [Cordyceps sp. RAO-2017]